MSSSTPPIKTFGWCILTTNQNNTLIQLCLALANGAILNFTNNAMLKLLSGIPDRPINRKVPSILCQKLYQFIVLTLHKWRPSWFFLKIRCLMYVMATPLCQTWLETLWYTPKLWFCFYSVKNDINKLFHLAQMTAILYFIHNATLKILLDYIDMSRITETRMLDTNIMNLRLFCLK